MGQMDVNDPSNCVRLTGTNYWDTGCSGLKQTVCEVEGIFNKHLLIHFHKY